MANKQLVIMLYDKFKAWLTSYNRKKTFIWLAAYYKTKSMWSPIQSHVRITCSKVVLCDVAITVI